MFATPAYAQAAGSAAQSGGPASMIFFVLQMGLLFALAWFLLFRPQQKRMKALRDSIGAIKKNDQVVTAGGLIGKVTKVEESVVEIEIAPNVKVKVVKATIAEVTPSGGTKPAND